MSALGHKRTFALQNGVSALPLKATEKADMAITSIFLDLIQRSRTSRKVFDKRVSSVENRRLV
jgi:hypothetical protein